MLMLKPEVEDCESEGACPGPAVTRPKVDTRAEPAIRLEREVEGVVDDNKEVVEG